MRRALAILLLLGFWRTATAETNTLPFYAFGAQLCVPSAYLGTNNGRLRQTNGAIITDTLIGVGGSMYGLMGTNIGTSTIDAIISQDVQYSGETVAGYTNGAHEHSGIFLRLQDASNFAGMWLMSVANNELQEIDRVAGAETVLHIIPSTTLHLGQKYELTVNNLTGNAWTATFSDAATHALIYQTNGTYVSGVPATGYQGTHCYDAAMRLYYVTNGDGAGVKHMDAQGPGIFVNCWTNAQIGGAQITNGAVTLFADGSGKTTAGWRIAQTEYCAQNFVMNGTLLMRNASGSAGVAFRTDTNGNGYFFVYNYAAAKMCLYEGNPVSGTPPTLLTSASASFPALTNYPFVLSCVSNVLSWNLAGTILTNLGDSSFLSPGYVGYVESNTVAQFQGFTFTAQPTNSFPAPPPTPDIARWTISAGSGTTVADIVGSDTGTATSAAWTTGFGGKPCLSFNGTSSLVTMASSSAHNNTAFTISAWFNHPTGTVSGAQDVYSEGNSGNNTPIIEIKMLAGGAMQVLIRDDANSLSTATTSGTYNDGNDHFVCFVESAANSRSIWIDGAQLATDTVTVGSRTVTFSALGVQRRVSNANFWNGTIKDVSVFSTDQSANIPALYVAGPHP